MRDRNKSAAYGGQAAARCSPKGRAKAGFTLAFVGMLVAGLMVQSAVPGRISSQSAAAQAHQIVGIAHVLDGDTIEIAQERIRLHGIDAAEEDQRCRAASGGKWDCAQAATARLRTLIGSGQAACEPVGRDKYDRILARCRVKGLDVQEVLAREGLAWAYRKYSRDYAAAEDAARAEGRGIWQAPTEPPWE